MRSSAVTKTVNRQSSSFIYDKGLFSIQTYLVTKDDKDVFFYTLSKILLISALKINQSLKKVQMLFSELE